MINLPDPVPYYRLVWEIVRQVPAGKVTTFGQIASMIPPPDGIEMDDYAKLGARWVGDAMNRVSTIDDPDVPWHRVINAKGINSLSATAWPTNWTTINVTMAASVMRSAISAGDMGIALSAMFYLYWTRWALARDAHVAS